MLILVRYKMNASIVLPQLLKVLVSSFYYQRKNIWEQSYAVCLKEKVMTQNALGPLIVFVPFFQIESVLHQILEELKLLYTQHAPQLKPRPRDSSVDPGIQDTGQGVDPVYDMYTVLEGSALIPFIEVKQNTMYMQLDLFKN